MTPFARRSPSDEIPVVIVPDRTLFEQWYEEIAVVAADLDAKVLRAGDGHDEWRGVLRDWTAPGGGQRLVLVTMQTAQGETFRRALSAR